MACISLHFLPLAFSYIWKSAVLDTKSTEVVSVRRNQTYYSRRNVSNTLPALHGGFPAKYSPTGTDIFNPPMLTSHATSILPTAAHCPVREVINNRFLILILCSNLNCAVLIPRTTSYIVTLLTVHHTMTQTNSIPAQPGNRTLLYPR